MQKPLALSIAACLGLAGCNVFQKSETWDQAVRVRPGETTRDPDPSNTYAAKLHAALAGRGVEHKVVVYQYRYTTRLREEAVGTRTAVLYRDDSDRRYPWWLKDDRLNLPFWLPNGSLDKQVSFYIRRKAEVIETKEYPSQGGSSKATVAFAKAAPTLRPPAKPQTQVAATTMAPVRKAPAPVVTPKPSTAVAIVQAPAVKDARENKPRKIAAEAPETRKPAPQPVVVSSATAPKIKLPIAFFSPQRTVESPSEPLPPIAAGNSGSGTPWNPPAALESNEQSILTAPRDEHLEKLFRMKHGTDYNRFSSTDRRKMQQLQHSVASRE